MATVGIYPGTFDPVHDGHIAFCLEAIKTVGLERVILLPERLPREKKEVTDFTHRVAMLKLATQDYSGLEVAELDDNQFTVEHTLPLLKKQFGDDLALLIGSDVVRTFTYRWPGLDQLLDELSLVIALRKDDSADEITSIIKKLGRPVHYQCIPSPRLHATSTHVRHDGHDEHLDPRVQQYIAEHELYNQRKTT